MPRITTRNDNDDADILDRSDDFLEGAGRLRERHVRGQLHVKREAEIDARNVPRQTTQEYVWRRPTNLDAPIARPGYRYRWVRAEFRSEQDSINWNNRMREGWRPVDPSSVPDVALNFPVMPHADQSVIKVGSLVLMELPLERVQARAAGINEIKKHLNASVSTDTERASREGARIGAPSIMREERVVASTGRRPSTMAD